MTDRAYDKDTAWTHAVLPPIAPMATDHTAAVCIVGAGIAGLTTAYMLAKEGRGVIVLDDGVIGGGESGFTTAHIVNALDRRWTELAKLHSAKRLRLAAESHTAAINMIETIVTAENIDCDFRRVPGYLFAAPHHPASTIKDEVDAAHRAGLGLVVEVEQAPIPGFTTGPAAKFPEQAQFHILRYLGGLARAIESYGGKIYTRAHVTEIDEESKPDHVIVKTDRGVNVIANEVVLATNTPFMPKFSTHMKQAGYRTYVIGLRMPRGAVLPALFWDTEDPFHYVRLANVDGKDGPDEILIVGGEDHKTGQASDADQRHARLEAWARERFPMAGEVLHRWSGEVMETMDGLAFIGRVRKEARVIMVTGDCGNGMTHSTIAGMLINDLVHGRENEWAELYDPQRVNMSLQSASEYLKENLNTAAQYADWVTGGDLDDVEKLPAGCGAIMRKGLHKLAVYRDPQGHVHERSAVCPHLGCIVHWNSAEHTWDCPCHGSRFEATGRVVHGPATSDLKPVDTDTPGESEVPVGPGLAQTS
ncbi:MAG TPA: FAD-dependent oxidoreductase [Polyangiaceae bacterium]|jgi:glycine/D-amino acid oxidase-like deaminating enzyme/nitrite reductase/ring-hydroxylating ferredoxin subunit|nr:FAD-dependent oxidoreductase [Polyangiaceae bacterium]